MAKTSNLTHAMQIGHDTEPDDLFLYLNGYFDQDLYYIFECGPGNDFLAPWEWVLMPEIVRYAEMKGIEVPVDPPVDLSRMF